jgi:hypothetical protein
MKKKSLNSALKNFWQNFWCKKFKKNTISRNDLRDVFKGFFFQIIPFCKLLTKW